MTKLLMFGDLDATGFGTVTADLGKALIGMGVDMRFVSQNEFDVLPEPFASRTIDLLTYVQTAAGIDPTQMPAFIPQVLTGNGATLPLANGSLWGDWKPDAVLLLGDFYGVRLIVEPQIASFAEIPTFHYCPVEGHDLPPKWNDMWSVVTPIAMSKFGQVEMAKITGRIPPLMYHGVDTTLFRPVSPSDPIVLVDGKVTLTSKERCKQFFGIHPRSRLLLRTDRNMPRKGYPTMIRALAPVLEERPDVVLGLHCRSMDQGGYLHDTISKLPENLRSRVMVTDWGSLPREALVALYNAADVYVSTSAEGFGLTIAEALACGVPAVGLDYSAVPEVIGPAGRTVPVGKYLDNEYAHHWALPDEEKFGEAVGYLLDHPSKARALGAEGPRHVARNFTWSAAAEVMHGLLEPIEEEELELVAV